MAATWSASRRFVMPSAYLKQFLPKYASAGRARQDGRRTRSCRAGSTSGARAATLTARSPSSSSTPICRSSPPGRSTSRSPADPVRMERNPYFWQVDTEGNQLPYIDASSTPSIENNEVLKLWIARARSTAERGTSTSASTRSSRRTRARATTGPSSWRSARTDAYFPNSTSPGPGARASCSPRRSSARRSTSRSTARRSPTSSGTAWASRASTRRSTARRSTTRNGEGLDRVRPQEGERPAGRARA